MKNSQNICLYARCLRNVCTTMEDATTGCQINVDGVTVDPVAADLILNQLEQAQMLVLALTDKITDALYAVDGEQANTDESGTAFAAGELNSKMQTSIESPVTEEEKEG